MHFSTYAGVATALAVAGFVLTFSSIPMNYASFTLPLTPVASLEQLGSTTPLHTQIESLLPDTVLILPGLEATSTATTSPSLKDKLEDSSATTTASVVLPIHQEELARERLRDASVNILCTGNEGQIRGISGSGVIIDPRGIILTVAHVGQYHLLFDYPEPDSVSCVVRTGSPTTHAYLAEPIFISQSWIEENPTTLITKNPKGSGEHDFAVLAITQALPGSSLPAMFPFVPLSFDDPEKGAEVVIAAYPAQELESDQIRSSLVITLVTTTVKERYTFETTSVDLISLGGSEAAQTGSSGGGIMTMDGKLVGIITTSTTEGPYAARNLHAITPNHIRRSFAEDTRADFDAFIAESHPSLLVSTYEEIAEHLRSVLIGALES